ncbi:nucleotide-binding universal stress UspA family protein [Bacillus mesophilus]|uniref:Universal stress protein n=1 Tax=Bacillus mesophilus TaxID=1808955 RepID=A0A6M0QAE0_9BACI|nr:universal stress protein [Bacillus mesophilus]MBM7662711.1 nucleotide-binding universal stress UspA family protein [Bacillus mesophilus]NEY73227.1 universal stress protein [Bacillus mesophilus]
MEKPSKILVAYDGSELSKKALEYAKFLVSDHEQAELEVVTVMMYLGAYDAYSFKELRKTVESETSLLVEEVKDMLSSVQNPTSVHMLEGDPSLQIIKLAEEKGVDTIVLGSRGLGRFKEFFLGSVSHNVVQMAKCPVLIVK